MTSNIDTSVFFFLKKKKKKKKKNIINSGGMMVGCSKRSGRNSNKNNKNISWYN